MFENVKFRRFFIFWIKFGRCIMAKMTPHTAINGKEKIKKT